MAGGGKVPSCEPSQSANRYCLVEASHCFIHLSVWFWNVQVTSTKNGGIACMWKQTIVSENNLILKIIEYVLVLDGP